MLILQAVSVAIAGLCAMACAVSLITLLKHRSDTMLKVEAETKEDIQRIDRKIDGLSDRVHDMLGLIKTHLAEQAIINKFTQATLDSLMKRMDNLERD